MCNVHVRVVGGVGGVGGWGRGWGGVYLLLVSLVACACACLLAGQTGGRQAGDRLEVGRQERRAGVRQAGWQEASWQCKCVGSCCGAPFPVHGASILFPLPVHLLSLFFNSRRQNLRAVDFYAVKAVACDRLVTRN